MKKIVLLSVTLFLCWHTVLAAAAPAGPKAPKVTVTKENPLFVDLKGRSISILAEVNGKYFHQATRHGVVFSGGSNGEKSIFRSYAKPEDLHAGLMKLGLNPGNNMTRENGDKTHVQGDLLEVSVTWEGATRTYSLDEVIPDSNNKTFQIRFGGNLPNSLQLKTGCLLCLDSCAVGITSNANYTMGAVEKRNEVVFKGNSKLLPPDGSLVVITIKAKG